jgi:hypothetical protein
VRFGAKRLATVRNEDIEHEARTMLRERIERTPWFQNGMTRKQRQAAIEREVDRTWHLFIFDAAQRLIDRAAQGQHR